jgi:hypothetical protein
MDSSSVDLTGSEVESIQLEAGRLRVRFSQAYIIKTIAGSVERTRWRQVGELIFESVELEAELPECPCVCAGGDVGHDIYTFRDMLPLPFKSPGPSFCELRFAGTDQRLKLRAAAVVLEMEDRPRYIEHIRPA